MQQQVVDCPACLRVVNDEIFHKHWKHAKDHNEPVPPVTACSESQYIPVPNVTTQVGNFDIWAPTPAPFNDEFEFMNEDPIKVQDEVFENAGK